jgi:hypothetical protein
MFPDKKKTIYAEKKSVLLKDFKEMICCRPSISI